MLIAWHKAKYMKYFYLLCTFLVFSITQAQIVNIPDPNFKNALLNYPIVIDTNGDGEIQVSEAASFDGGSPSRILGLDNQNISDLTGIDAFTNVKLLVCTDNNLTTLEFAYNEQLESVFCSRNILTSIDVSNLPNLISLDCDANNLTELDTSNNQSLVQLVCNENLMTSLDISQNSNLETFIASNNQLTTINFPESTSLHSIQVDNNNFTNLDFSNFNSIVTLDVNGNQLSHLDVSNQRELFSLNADDNQLNSIFMKNGNQLYDYYLSFDNNPNLEFICADAFEVEQIENKLLEYGNTGVVVNSYCSFVPGSESFLVQGTSYIDIDGNGCNDTDPEYPYLKYLVSDGTSSEYFYNDPNGFYNMPLPEGSYTITPILENLEYFEVSPSSLSVDLPGADDPTILDFCVVPNDQAYLDLEIILIPLEAARPGFEADYKIIYRNKGILAFSGFVEFTFLDDLVSFVFASPNRDTQTDRTLQWNFENLMPFESRTINVTMLLNTPIDPNFPLNGGDILSYNANIGPTNVDIVPQDNASSLRQIVVNSFDPNDKTCLEGDTITPEMVGEYVHYLIRFENTGTADAINIVVKDMIDTSKFDVSTLIPLHGSHEFVTRITNTNEVEFIFENINIPFDDANNDGYVVFKIKTLPSLALGDTFANDAEIYFDYNAPIITNDFSTTVAEPLSVSESTSNEFKMHPNPVADLLYIEAQTGIQSITIYDLNGRQLSRTALTGQPMNYQLNMGNLSKGMYFVKTISSSGEMIQKIIKD